MPRDPLEALRLPSVPVEPRPQFAAALWRRLQGAAEPAARQGATVRYFVDDLDRAVDFYCRSLGFEEELRPAPTFAMLYRGDLRLVLASPVPADHHGGGSRPMPDGTKQGPGGWNRIMLEVSDLAGTVERLRAAGLRLRNDIVTGVARTVKAHSRHHERQPRHLEP
ncbi:MAG TPA: VOC family protein [Solirubrobacteraceae bacterium]